MMQVFDKDTARLKYFKITHDNFNTFILKIMDQAIQQVILSNF